MLGCLCNEVIEDNFEKKSAEESKDETDLSHQLEEALDLTKSCTTLLLLLMMMTMISRRRKNKKI